MSKLNALASVLEAPKVVSEVVSKEDKFKELSELAKKLNKDFNTTGSLQVLGARVNQPVPSISTHLPSLDWDVIGCGGIPRGRIVEVFGPESCGKTTFCLHLVACEQADTDNLCAYIDAEHSLDPTYAAKLGVNVKELLISQPDSGEQALETANQLIDSKLVSLIIIDSVAALVPQAELDGDMGDAHIGLQARLMSQAMRKLRGKAAMNGITVIFINQIREKVGVMFGSPETTSGGRALKFYASLRLDVRKRKPIGDKEAPIGHENEFKAVKNKMGPPMRSVTLPLGYGTGYDPYTDLIEYAVRLGAIEKSEKGGYYSFDGENIAQGLTSAVERVTLDSELKQGIESKLGELRKANGGVE